LKTVLQEDRRIMHEKTVSVKPFFNYYQKKLYLPELISDLNQTI